MPQILDVATGKVPFFQTGGKDGIIWSLIFIIGTLPGVEYNILQKVWLDYREKRQKAEHPSVPFDRTFESLLVLLFGCFFQLVTALAFFWVDIIPGFGYSANISVFLELELRSFLLLLSSLLKLIFLSFYLEKNYAECDEMQL